MKNPPDRAALVWHKGLVVLCGRYGYLPPDPSPELLAFAEWLNESAHGCAVDVPQRYRNAHCHDNAPPPGCQSEHGPSVYAPGRPPIAGLFERGAVPVNRTAEKVSRYNASLLVARRKRALRKGIRPDVTRAEIRRVQR